jgi:hypothetical protein
MVEFMTSYTPSMDLFREEPIAPMEKVDADIEKPIIPISEIGTTSIDAGEGNILQELEKNIKMGTKKIQIVFSGRGGSGVTAGGGPSLYGKDVRTSLYEKAKATGVQLVGVELSPAVISGLAGFDPQSGRLSEERRQQDLKKVRDAVRFAADVSKGGCVDLWSQEFSRNIYDASWNDKSKVKNKDDEKWAGMFYDYSPDELKKPAELEKEGKQQSRLLRYLIDDRNGEPIKQSAVYSGEKTQEVRYMTAEDYERQYGTKIIGQNRGGKRLDKGDHVDINGNYVDIINPESVGKLIPYMDPEKHQFATQDLTWEQVLDRTKTFNEKYAEKGKEVTPEEYLYKQRLEVQKALYKGQSLYYSSEVENLYDKLKELNDLKALTEDIKGNMDKDQKQRWIRDTVLPKLAGAIRGGLNEREVERLTQMDPAKAVQDAIQRTQNTLNGFQEQATAQRVQQAEVEEVEKHITTPHKFGLKRSVDSYSDAGIDALKVTKERKLDKPVYIGPELGWASESYGGHPDEFIELIKESRKKMAEKLVKTEGYSENAAEEAAKSHIKGMVDTSHLAMWFKHFKKKDGWTDEKHLKEFNEWMKEQGKKIAKAGVAGGVQVVDTITGEHSHLPAGQGIFDVAGFVKVMKEEGFKGDIIAEGHEEDTMRIGQGRILTETWRAFGSNIAGVGHGPTGLRGWGGIQHSYFGQVMPPTYVVGAYAPSNEWSLWSETPFE